MDPANNAWEQWDDNNWYTLSDANSWERDIDQMIGVMIEFASTDIEDAFVSWRNLSLRPAYPNPANESVRLNFGLSEADEVEIVLYSVDGKILKQIAKGTLPAGEYTEVMDVQDLAAGTYAYGIFTRQARLMNRFVISR